MIVLVRKEGDDIQTCVLPNAGGEVKWRPVREWVPLQMGSLAEDESEERVSYHWANVKDV